MRVTLTLLDGSKEGMTRSYSVDSISIGKASDNRFVVREGKGVKLSDHHAEVRRQHGEFLLLDLNSHSGTYLNGERVDSSEPSSLSDEDVIRLGEDGIRIRFDLHRSEDRPERRKAKAHEKAHGRSVGAIVKDVLIRSEDLSLPRRVSGLFSELTAELLRDRERRRRLILLLVLFVLIGLIVLGVMLN